MKQNRKDQNIITQNVLEIKLMKSEKIKNVTRHKQKFEKTIQNEKRIKCDEKKEKKRKDKKGTEWNGMKMEQNVNENEGE